MIYKYALPVYLDGFTTQSTIDVSAQMADAKTGIWSLYAPDSTEVLGALTVLDSGHIQINSTPALSEGEYMLVGIA